MAFSLNAKAAAMDRATKKLLQTLLMVTNSIIGIAGVGIFVYSLWMFFYCLRNHAKYLFSSWFIWGCFVIGIIFCLTACVGSVAAFTRIGPFLSTVQYIIMLFLLLVMETLLTADIILHKKWAKDFPDDPADMFDDFVDYLEDNPTITRLVTWLLLFSQVIAFSLAVALRVLDIKLQSHHRDHKVLPFLNQHISPYVVGQQHSATKSNVVDNTTQAKRTPFSWLVAANVWPPCSL